MFRRRSNRRMRQVWCLTAVTGLLMLSGCVQEIADQLRVDVMEPTGLPFDTPENRTPVPGTIARGQSWERTPTTTGRDGAEFVEQIPVKVDEALMKRGRQRFNIYCQHCHGPSGYGDGMVVQRGFPAPPSYHIERLRNAPDGKLFTVITDGLGRMPALGRRIPVQDRWAIVAYVRALQLSQSAQVGTLPEEIQQQLQDKTSKSDSE